LKFSKIYENGILGVFFPVSTILQSLKVETFLQIRADLLNPQKSHFFLNHQIKVSSESNKKKNPKNNKIKSQEYK
jgi:hypothetical protein